ncbi:hypothetical protein M408DRAFT_121038 [Serendipita vermifera MAFF 305830]|uniref:Uncharacterized protein n=1 Tax=Serendipita vermifera MAFF 305830 TaxID=933852 RepID=A0A0C2XJK6_SERVB|nr:hypothetical protein M408DRAFT_121038 [Serendipita vermifera MAFF 305830]
MDSEPQLFLEPIKEFLRGTTNSVLSEIAETFLQIVPEPVHFQAALNVLLPIMNDLDAKLESRIQAIFLLWYLYRNHSLDMNPFQAAFREMLDDERSRATKGSLAEKPNALRSTLDMILSGQAQEVRLALLENCSH